MKDSGLTAVVDARRQPPSPALFSALRSLQVRGAERSVAGTCWEALSHGGHGASPPVVGS